MKQELIKITNDNSEKVLENYKNYKLLKMKLNLSTKNLEFVKKIMSAFNVNYNVELDICFEMDLDEAELTVEGE